MRHTAKMPTLNLRDEDAYPSPSPTPHASPESSGINVDQHQAADREHATPNDNSRENVVNKVSCDLDVNNIIHGKRRRKPVNLATFYNSFAEAKSVINPLKLHRQDLPDPPKNRKEMLKHQY